ncbi:MAG: HAD family phosphatase [Clostridia bacterium]|nr:HAD family phosphatase [Clostridia bacterium]
MDDRLIKADAIIFDVGNVLLTYSPERICTLLPEAVRAPLRDALFGPEYRWGAFDRGIESNEAIARRIAQIAGLPDEWPQIIHILHHFPETMHPMPLSRLIPRLKAMGKRLYALTNFPEPSFSNACRIFPFLQQLDGAVVSAVEKLAKPDPAIFRLIAERYHLSPEKSLFIDDLLPNIQGAEKAGFQTWHYAGEDKFLNNFPKDREQMPPFLRLYMQRVHDSPQRNALIGRKDVP